ncbi:hypothetical protein LCGC14_0993050 [marine sediment metagenome]|uniref:Uncharacterized protein n=1 Tax=marine sediment metagenome TaxID=412755 RepID=A0A0F9NRQ7_9ZZZZ
MTLYPFSRIRNVILAEYLDRVEPIRQKYLHDDHCGSRCPCHRNPILEEQFKVSRYEDYQKEIDPIHTKMMGLLEQARGAQCQR